MPERFIWKHGFPHGTPEQDAVTTAMDAATAHYDEMGEDVSELVAEVVETTAHTEAGEFLVVVEGFREKRSEKDKKEKNDKIVVDIHHNSRKF